MILQKISLKKNVNHLTILSIYKQIQLRLVLTSYNKYLFTQVILNIKQILNDLKFETIFISLPVKKIIMCCLLRSPHIDKHSREQIGLFIYSGFFTLKVSNMSDFYNLLQKNIPLGISFELHLYDI